MRNKIDFSQSPGDLFLDPYADPGLTFLSAPDFIWRPISQGRVTGFTCSDHDQIRIKTERFIRYTQLHKTFRKAIEFKTSLVELQDASFRKSYSMAKEKCLLGGAAGTRLLNRYCWENEAAPDDPEQRLVGLFHARQQANTGKTLPVSFPSPPNTLDFAIECRNTFNFYHFTTETLCHLCLLSQIDFQGRIYIHFPNAEDKTRGFTMSFIRALFPDLADRVQFERTPKDYDRVLTAFNLFNSFYFSPPEVTAPINALAPSGEMWKGTLATRSSQSVLSMNSLDSSLLLLRDHALAAVKNHDTSHLPRRFYVGRKPGEARVRSMQGEDELLELLSAMGFAHVAFEDLSPLDQIGLMANAEVMISPHGAGFTNMLFANPNALVIELGTLQTAVHRWGDFWPLAIASGCRYVSFFADYNQDDPLKDPSFAKDGIVPVALGRRGLGEVLAFIAASIGHTPKLSRAEDVARLVRQLNRTDQPEKAVRILETHQHLLSSSVKLSIAQAETHKAKGEGHAELIALTQAWEADQTRWQTLVQIIWCARKLGQVEVITWAVRLLADEFPDQCLEVVKDRDWLKELL